MVEKEVKFRITLDDQATSKMQDIKAQMDSLNNASMKMGASVGGGGGSSPITSSTNAQRPNASSTPYGMGRGDEFHKTYKKPGGKEPVDPSKQMIPGEWARPLRAVGAYRSAWFAGQDTSAGPMKAAAGLFILQAVADGIKKIVEILSEASPALRAELKILKVAMNELLRPIGDLLGTVLRPVARAMLQANAYARSSMSEEGISQTDLSEYYARYFAALGAVASGHEVLGENAVDLTDTINTLDTAFTVLGYTTLPGLINGIVQFATWFDENKALFPIALDATTTAANSMIALESPLNNLTKTVVKLDEAMTNFYPMINSATDALGGVGDVVGGLGDVGKGASDFVSGIVGYFR